MLVRRARDETARAATRNGPVALSRQGRAGAGTASPARPRHPGVGASPPA
ncbi:hypothetical protein GCM10010336_57540 [Streptomyces goshikiensis]|nr:hypothetical protein GCM10010336_57540 [Streptomyces goshikiensis]